MKIRKIEDQEHDNFEYITLNFYILENSNIDKLNIIYIKQNMHIVNYLRIKMLVDIDIINFKNIIFDLKNERFFIDNCKIIALIICTSFKLRINCNINTFAFNVLSALSMISIAFKFKNILRLL